MRLVLQSRTRKSNTLQLERKWKLISKFLSSRCNRVGRLAARNRRGAAIKMLRKFASKEMGLEVALLKKAATRFGGLKKSTTSSGMFYSPDSSRTFLGSGVYTVHRFGSAGMNRLLLILLWIGFNRIKKERKVDGSFEVPTLCSSYILVQVLHDTSTRKSSSTVLLSLLTEIWMFILIDMALKCRDRGQTQRFFTNYRT